MDERGLKVPNGFQMGIPDWETPPQPQLKLGATDKELRAGNQDAAMGSSLVYCSRAAAPATGGTFPGWPGALGCNKLRCPHCGLWGQPLCVSPAFGGASAASLADIADTACHSSATGAAVSPQQSWLQCED